MKTFKEYAIMTRGYAIGGIDSVHPIASLGDVPPRGKGSRDTRSVCLTANYTSQAPGTIKPMVTADTKRIPKKPVRKISQINIVTYIQMKIQKELFTV